MLHDTAAAALACSHAVSECLTLIEELEAQKAADASFVAAAHPIIAKALNHVDLQDGADLDDTEDRCAFALRARAGSELTLSAEYLYACLLSSTCFEDVQRFNPFVPSAVLHDCLDLAVAVMLHASRVGHVNRCLSGARELLKLLRGTSKSRPGLALKAESLAAMLSTQRHFVHPQSMATKESSTRGARPKRGSKRAPAAVRTGGAGAARVRPPLHGFEFT